jgi:hypothetical protein
MVEQARPVSQGTRVAAGRLSRHNVVVEVPNREAARGAIEQLGRIGVEADKVSISGPGVQEGPQTRSGAKDVDARLLRYMAIRVAVAATVGLVLGALLGLLGALLLPYESTGENILVVVVGAAILVSTLFALTASMFFLSPAMPWETTFLPSGSGAMFVGFHSEEAEDADRAERILRLAGHHNVRRIDR